MVQINGVKISKDEKPFIIAEMSGNHNNSIDRALELVDAAAAAGVQALKIQTYTPETMTLDLREREFFISDPSSPWFGKSLFELYEVASTPWAWHAPIFERAKKNGLIAFSTPFDLTAVDFLESLEVPCYKIASFENIDLPLIRYVAKTGKPMIISTGMASLAEIDEAVRTARDAGCSDLVLLKCTSTYPASAASSNLSTIKNMEAAFGCEVGLSDHTMGVGVSLASIALGATVIEKHMTLSRSDGGVDSGFSMEPSEMALLVAEAERARLAVGKVSYGPTPAEKGSLKFRRSLYVTEDLRKGDVLTNENLKSIRPGLGISPKYIDIMLGRSVKRDIGKGTALTWDLL